MKKVGLLTIREGRILLCRKKRGSGLLILPGGKIEAGESEIQCLKRELQEELGDVEVSQIRYIGSYSDRSADDATRVVSIELYQGELIGEPEPRAEIESLVWFGEENDRCQLAPSLVNKILPDVIERGILPWDFTPFRLRSSSRYC